MLSAVNKSLRVITLNRPKALNALNLDMVRMLTPMVKGCVATTRAATLFRRLAQLHARPTHVLFAPPSLLRAVQPPVRLQRAFTRKRRTTGRIY